MKVLLINPMLLARSKSDLEYPLNLIYLAGGLKDSAAGITPVLLDLTFEYLRRGLEGVPVVRAQEDCVVRAWKESGPFDIVGIGGVCDNFHLTLRLAEFVKKKFSVPIVIGGPHVTFVGREIVKSFPFVDFVVLYDGIAPLVRLCEQLGRRAFEKVPALVYRDPLTGEVRQTPRSDAPPNVMSVVPDYGLQPAAEYLKLNPYCLLTVLAGTGCPFRCTYCSTALMWDHRYRVFPPKQIAAGLRRLKEEFPKGNFTLVHDNLLCSRDFTLKLCSELEKGGAAWGGSSRVDHIAGDLPLMRKLKSAGCRGLFIGIETGSPRMQRVIGKKIDLSKVIPLTKDLVSEGLNPVYSFILGFPGETDEDRDMTVRLAFRLRVLGAERVNILHLFPLPGTAEAGPRTFTPGKDHVYRPPLLAADEKTRKQAMAHPYIFRHLWSAVDGPGKTRLSPDATWEIHDFGVEHYRSFNYLFSRAGLMPRSLFPLLGRKRAKHEVLKDIAALVAPEQARVFLEIFRYETLVSRLVGDRLSRPKFRPCGFRGDRKYALAKSSVLFSTPVPLPAYLGAELPETPAETSVPRTYLCLVDTGENIEAFEVEKDLFAVLSGLRGIHGGSLTDLLSCIGDKKRRRAVEGYIRQLLKMGAIQYA